MAAAATGLLSGTATGSEPAPPFFCRIETRACALIAGTTARRMYQGRFASVAFTSTNLVAHGMPPSLKSEPPWFQWVVELMRMWTFDCCVGAICRLYGVAELGSPA